MWVIDIRHWLNEEQTKEAVPKLKNKVRYVTDIITYATSLAAGIQVGSPPKCWRRPKRKPCAGKIDIAFKSPEQIYWNCPECQDDGIITGWEGLIWDMSDSTSRVH